MWAVTCGLRSPVQIYRIGLGLENVVAAPGVAVSIVALAPDFTRLPINGIAGNASAVLYADG